MTHVVINQKFLAASAGALAGVPSEAVLKAAEMFGIGLDETFEVTLYEDLVLEVRPGDVVYITGPSGSGKSVLLTRLQEALHAAGPGDVAAVDLAEISLAGGRAVIDLMAGPLTQRLRILSAAGLADAFLLLRKPHELSEGQRWRLRLALAIQQCGMRRAECGVEQQELGARDSERGTENDRPPIVDSSPFAPSSEFRAQRWSLLIADEFCSALDRLCARAVAYRVRRLADATGVTVLAASAHDDLVEDLDPDILVIKHEACRVEVRYADPARPSPRPSPSKVERVAGGQARGQEQP
jgi:uncharacterized protein